MYPSGERAVPRVGADRDPFDVEAAVGANGRPWLGGPVDDPIRGSASSFSPGRRSGSPRTAYRQATGCATPRPRATVRIRSCRGSPRRSSSVCSSRCPPLARVLAAGTIAALVALVPRGGSSWPSAARLREGGPVARRGARRSPGSAASRGRPGRSAPTGPSEPAEAGRARRRRGPDARRRPLQRRAGVPARASDPGGQRRPDHGVAGRAAARGEHPGRERDAPPARRRRPRAPQPERPRAASHQRRAGRPPTRSSGATPCASGCSPRSSGSAGPSPMRRRSASRRRSHRGSRPASTSCSAIPRPARTATRSISRPRSAAPPASRSDDPGGRARDDLPRHRGGRGGRRAPVLPRGARPPAGRPRDDPRPLRIARLPDARRSARPGDARPPARRPRPRPPGDADPALFHRVPGR